MPNEPRVSNKHSIYLGRDGSKNFDLWGQNYILKIYIKINQCKSDKIKT